MKQFGISIFSLVVYISLSFVLSHVAFANENEIQQKIENAKKYVIGTNLGLIAMEYSNIGEDGAQEIGYNSYEFYKKTGKTDAVIRVWLLNSSDKVISVNPLNFKVVTENGYTVPLSNYTFRTRNPFPSTSLEPKTKIDGFVVFELAIDDDRMGRRRDSILKIIYDDGMGSRVEREYKDAVIMGFYKTKMENPELFK